MARPEQVNQAIADQIADLRSAREFAGAERFAVVYPTFRHLLMKVRIAAFDAQEELDAVETPAAAPAPEGPASWQEIHDDLSIAASRLQGYGASAAQVRYIATLAVNQGLTLSQITMSTLSRGEASAMISSMKGN